MYAVRKKCTDLAKVARCRAIELRALTLVIVRFPEAFSQQLVKLARSRLEELIKI